MTKGFGPPPLGCTGSQQVKGASAGQTKVSTREKSEKSEESMCQGGIN